MDTERVPCSIAADKGVPLLSTATILFDPPEQTAWFPVPGSWWAVPGRGTAHAAWLESQGWHSSTYSAQTMSLLVAIIGSRDVSVLGSL